MSLSHKEKLEYTIFGYVRSNYKDEIPDDITRICLEYYNKIEIIWDVFCDRLADSISDDGLEVYISEGRGSYSTFASSIGWNEGIHSFALKHVNPTSSYSGFGIGVVSSEEIARIGTDDEEYFLFTQNRNVIGYSLDALHSIQKVQNGSYNWLHSSNVNVKDAKPRIATVVIDCDNWKLTFYINDKICNESVEIVKDKTYHPVFTVWQGTMIFLRLTETTIDVDKI